MKDWASIIDDYKTDLLTDLEGLLCIPSVKDTASVSTKAPFGKGIQEALDYMLALGERDGFTVKNLDYYAGHLEIGQGESLLGLLSHLDVVPVNPSQWETAPFTPVIKEGRLYARGALDDKGPTLMAYYAIKILKELGYTFNRRIRLILGTDEENDWQGVKHYFKHEEMPDFGIVPDGIFPMIYSEKGVVSIDLSSVHQASKYLQTFTSGSAYNLVPDQATAVLEGLPNLRKHFDEFLKYHNLEGKHSLQLHQQVFTIQGKSAHAAGPSQGINAGVYLNHFLNKLDLDDAAKSFVEFVDNYFYEDTSAHKLGIDFSDSQLGAVTNNLAMLDFNKGKVRLGLNLRYPASYDFSFAYSKLAALAETNGFCTAIISHKKPSQTDLQAPETELLLNVYREKTGDQTLPLAIGGITYGRVFKRGVTFGPTFLGKPATLHQPNEYIELTDLFKALEIYLEALYQLVTVEGQS